MTHTTKKTIYAVIAVFALVAFVVVLVRATGNTRFLSYAAPNDEQPSLAAHTQPVLPTVATATAADGSTTAAAAPSGPRLVIPAIKVNAAIEDVGITDRGEMDTPIRLADVGWYEYGTAPGDVGSAVIDGHVDNSLSLPAVFYNLKNVVAGDDVYVTTETGKQLHFVVTDVEDYALTDAPTQEIFHDTSGKSLLRLITCQGTWDSGQFDYDHRIVVTAQLVS